MTAETTAPLRNHSGVALLEAKEVEVRFGGIVALDGVSLTLSPGQVKGVIGPNGAGKTTLFDVIAGARAVTKGSVHMGGSDVSSRNDIWRARNGLRRTFQRQQLFGGLTIEENVLAALEWSGGLGSLIGDLVSAPSRRRLTKERQQLVAETLEFCGLKDVANRQVAGLPIGVGRFVELARALVGNPSVLLLDEPRSGLGTVDSARLSELLSRVATERGCSILLVEHDMSFVMGLCEQILVLHLGTVLATGTPSEIQANQAVRDAYLG